MIKRLFFLLTIIALAALPALACTSAIIAASATRDGRPLLWKNRDTSTTDNVVEYIAPSDGSYGYVALFNANDRKHEQAWIGMNDVGFAVMNTASYNIKDDRVPQKDMDREGYVMTIALRSCRTVDDFARLLETLPRPMGVEANFGVIDAEGNGAFFETNNHSFVRFDLKDAPDGVLVRSNYSHSGREGEGYGYIREANANCLLAPYLGQQEITPELLTETLSRSFYHDVYKKDMLGEEEQWLIDQDFIPRYTSTATIVIEGCHPVEDASAIKSGELSDQYIMWTGLGYPPVSEIVPVWCRPDGVDTRLRGLEAKGHSQLGDEAKRKRAEVFPIHKGSGQHYIKTSVLVNPEGTGYLQTVTRQNHETYQRFRDR